jgi:transcription regulator XylR-like protein
MPHVALFVETSLGYGRGVLRGIANYVASHQPWSIYVDQRGLNDPLPDWLNDWNGHGIIMRAQTRWIAEVVANLKVPAVDTQPDQRPGGAQRHLRRYGNRASGGGSPARTTLSTFCICWRGAGTMVEAARKRIRRNSSVRGLSLSHVFTNFAEPIFKRLGRRAMQPW